MIYSNEDLFRAITEAYNRGFKDAKQDATGVHVEDHDEAMEHFREEFLKNVTMRLHFSGRTSPTLVEAQDRES